jgi:hypothetical protein
LQLPCVFSSSLKVLKKREKKAVGVVESTTVTHSDALATILKVKTWAAEVGGLRTLKKLVDALSE